MYIWESPSLRSYNVVLLPFPFTQAIQLFLRFSSFLCLYMQTALAALLQIICPMVVEQVNSCAGR